MTVTIYQNPACGTSRTTLALIRATGVEPGMIHYLETPPSREELASLVQRMGIGPRDHLRENGPSCAALGLRNPWFTDDHMDAMMDHPIPINRPIVFGPGGVKLCRPAEEVLTVLDRSLQTGFVKEDGEVVPANG